MANSLFSLTPVNINKVIGTAWNDDGAITCHMAASVAELNSDKAKAKFVALLATMGIKISLTRKFADNLRIEVFNTTGKEIQALSDVDKRKAISIALFKTDDKAFKFDIFDGEELDALYKSNVKEEKQTAPYQLYRITVGEHTVYRVSNDGEQLHSLMSKAIRHIVERTGGDDSAYKVELPE